MLERCATAGTCACGVALVGTGKGRGRGLATLVAKHACCPANMQGGSCTTSLCERGRLLLCCMHAGTLAAPAASQQKPGAWSSNLMRVSAPSDPGIAPKPSQQQQGTPVHTLAARGAPPLSRLLPCLAEDGGDAASPRSPRAAGWPSVSCSGTASTSTISGGTLPCVFAPCGIALPAEPAEARDRQAGSSDQARAALQHIHAGHPAGALSDDARNRIISAVAVAVARMRADGAHPRMSNGMRAPACWLA